MDLLNLVPALIFSLAGLVAIYVLIKPFILSVLPHFNLQSVKTKKKPKLYQVKIERTARKSKDDDFSDDIIIH